MSWWIVLASLFFTGLFSAPVHATFYNPNEVSILLPLPAADEPNPLWKPSTAGALGALIPERALKSVPSINLDIPRPQLYGEWTRVVSVRLDPCFTEGEGPQACRHQIRMIWQPLGKLNGAWTTLDAALHSFYDLNDAQWAAFMNDWALLKSYYTMDPLIPLQVHPILRAQGYSGDYWRAFSTVILKVVGEGNLSRVTAMTVNPQQNVWVFTGFDYVNGQARRITIPRVSSLGQAVFAVLDDPTELHLNMNPQPQGVDNFLIMMRDSREARKSMNEAAIAEGVREALVMENPRLSNPGTADCASCHMSQGVPGWAARTFPQWSFPRMFPREMFSTDFGPTMGSYPSKTFVLRAFGYFGTDPVISRRTFFETALTARALSLPAQGFTRVPVQGIRGAGREGFVRR